MGKTSINFFSYLKLSLVLLIIVFSSISTTGETLPNAKIAIVYSIGGLGDLSFNDAAYKGLIEAMAANPGITTSQVEPTDFVGVASAIESFAADGTYDLIIGIGFIAQDAITASATAHTNVNFLIIDTVVDLPNVASIIFAEHEGSFLAGALAAMVSETEDIAFLGGINIPLINKFFAGYYEGARFINPAITVRLAYSPDPANPWGDLAGGKVVGLNFIDQGSDVIYSAAGGTSLGIMDAVEEASISGNKSYAIGVDSNQDHIKPGFILTSMMKRIDVAVYSQIQALVDGTWNAGIIELSLKENGVSLTEMEFTQAEANTEFETGITRLEKIDELKHKIIIGAIVVNKVLTDYVETSNIEHVPPDLSSPSDVEYYLGETGNQINWDVGDAHPDVFDVFRNGSLILSDQFWNNGTIHLGVDGLSIGIYELKIIIYDKSGNMNSDTAIVTVKKVPITIDPTTNDDQTTTLVDEPTLDLLNAPQVMMPISFLIGIIILRNKKYT